MVDVFTKEASRCLCMEHIPNRRILTCLKILMKAACVGKSDLKSRVTIFKPTMVNIDK